MSVGYYDLLGVAPTASTGHIRRAWAVAISRLRHRRRSPTEETDPDALAGQEARVHEAWSVLSDPVARRRYDALLSWHAARAAGEVLDLWSHAAEAQVHPAAAVALSLLRVTRGVGPAGRVQPTPLGAAGDPPTLVPHLDDASSDPVPGWVAELGFSGALLRRIREARGLSLVDVAERTRISHRFLAALESERAAELPPATFVRGYLQQLAVLLHLDPEPLVRGYLQRVASR